MTRRENDFSDATKRTLAERVAWRCSFAGCGIITVGPDPNNLEKRRTTGKAAHIIAASSKGPRGNDLITSDSLKHISNGIWMCDIHAGLIDSAARNYSEETLRKWKIEAERIAFDNLQLPHSNHFLFDSSTLLQIGSEIIFYVEWKSATSNTWTFKLLKPFIGDIEKLREYIRGFNELIRSERYVVIESQGDAGIISGSPILEARGQELFISLTIENPPKFTDPTKGKSSIALDSNNNMQIDSNGNIAIVSSVEATIQDFWTLLGTIKGESLLFPESGSLINRYYYQYKDDLVMLSRLFKLELIRLSLIPDDVSHPTRIKRIQDVKVLDITLINQRLSIRINIILGNDERWCGDILVFVGNPQ